MGKDYYKILEVSRDADEATIKKSYRKLAMKWHPDKNIDNQQVAQAKFQEISEAYDVLSDPQKRKTYDQFGEDGLKNGGFNFGSAQDIFAQFFGGSFGGFGGFEDFGGGFGGMGGGFGGMGGMGSRRQKAPEPLEVSVNCTLEQLFTGCVKKLKINRTINGKEDPKIFEINVKPGWKSGTTITFEKEGDQQYNRPAQDIKFIIQEKPHDFLKRVGDDLIVEEIITLKEALCGIKITKQGLDGNPVILEVHDVIAPNQDRRVKGAGMPNKYGQRGDMIFKFKISFPSQLTPQQVQILSTVLPE